MIPRRHLLYAALVSFALAVVFSWLFFRSLHADEAHTHWLPGASCCIIVDVGCVPPARNYKLGIGVTR